MEARCSFLFYVCVCVCVMNVCSGVCWDFVSPRKWLNVYTFRSYTNEIARLLCVKQFGEIQKLIKTCIVKNSILNAPLMTKRKNVVCLSYKYRWYSPPPEFLHFLLRNYAGMLVKQNPCDRFGSLSISQLTVLSGIFLYYPTSSFNYHRCCEDDDCAFKDNRDS